MGIAQQLLPRARRYILAMPPLLNRKNLKQELVAAERYISEGQKHIRDQKQIIAQLEYNQDNGAALAQARSLLKTIVNAQALHIEHRDKLQLELLVLGAL